jgi:hypothetical protein
VNIELESPEAPFGRVKRGEIILTGHIFPALFEKTLQFYHRYRFHYEGVLRAETDEEFRFLHDFYFHYLLYPHDIREPAYLLWLQSSPPSSLLDRTLSRELLPPQAELLSAGAGTVIEETDPGNLEIALVLQNAGQGMEYRRIGILAASGEKAVALRRLFGSVEKQTVILI